MSHASAAAPYGVGDLLADQVDPDGIARIAAEVLERAFEYPREVADVLAPHAHRFGCGRGDGLALLDELLQRAGSRGLVVLLADVALTPRRLDAATPGSYISSTDIARA